MKIVALLPVKNEAWILPSYLEAISPIADLILALDDGSTDGSVEILKQNSKVQLYTIKDLGSVVSALGDAKNNTGEQKLVDMSARRTFLLKKAREAGATHQLWLDADEIIPTHFQTKLQEVMGQMKPGQKMVMSWITLWKKASEQRVDRVWKNLSKDFIFCDDGISLFPTQKLSEGRTPSNALYGNERVVSDIPVVHYQFVFFKRAMIKQAWYRCHELLQGARSARRINATYSIAEDSSEVQTIKVPTEWSLNDPIANSPLMQNFKVEESSYFKDILKWFDEKNAAFFEGLNIWDIKELYDAFIARVDREPKAQVFPRYIIKLNEFRHFTVSLVKKIIYKIKNLISNK